MVALHKFLIERDDESDLEFLGQCVGCGVAYAPQTDNISRATMARLYRTEGDTWVAEMVEYEEFAGIRNTLRSSASSSASADGLVPFLGNGRAAKALYASVGSILSRPILVID